MNPCIITGCALVQSWSNAWAWGDLFEVAGAYVFNPARSGMREQAVWHHDAQPTDNANRDTKVIRVLSGEGSVFVEVGGVCVFPKMNGELNEAATKYVTDGREL